MVRGLISGGYGACIAGYRNCCYVIIQRYNALRMAAHDDYMEFVTFLMSHGAYVGFQRKVRCNKSIL